MQEGEKVMPLCQIMNQLPVDGGPGREMPPDLVARLMAAQTEEE